jgi:hypothetical protein
MVKAVMAGGLAWDENAGGLIMKENSFVTFRISGRIHFVAKAAMEVVKLYFYVKTNSYFCRISDIHLSGNGLRSIIS